jgi:hypothetical protein
MSGPRALTGYDTSLNAPRLSSKGRLGRVRSANGKQRWIRASDLRAANGPCIRPWSRNTTPGG